MAFRNATGAEPVSQPGSRLPQDRQPGDAEATPPEAPPEASPVTNGDNWPAGNLDGNDATPHTISPLSSGSFFSPRRPKYSSRHELAPFMSEATPLRHINEDTDSGDSGDLTQTPKPFPTVHKHDAETGRRPSPSVNLGGSSPPSSPNCSRRASQSAAPAFLTASPEYSELQALRCAALLKEKRRAEARQRAQRWPKWDILKMVLWKNLTIRKRRKTQFVLLLVQIFLWFGIACFSIVIRSSPLHYAEEPDPGVTQLAPRVHAADLAAPIAVSFDFLPSPGSLNGTKLSVYPDSPVSGRPRPNGVPAMFESGAQAYSQSVDCSRSLDRDVVQNNLQKLMQSFVRYYAITYEGLQPPLRLFPNRTALAQALIGDKRMPYGIHVKTVDIAHRCLNYELVFWEKEVPVEDEAFNAYDCRSFENTYQYAVCAMRLYGKHGFLFAQTALNTAMLDVLAQNERNETSNNQDKKKPASLIPEYRGLLSERAAPTAQSKSGLSPKPEIQAETSLGGAFPHSDVQGLLTVPFSSVLPPNRFRLELPGFSVVAERYPEHRTVRSQAAEAASAAPFYFVLALISVFSFVVMDMVAEKESKMKEVMKTYGLSTGMFWLSWLLTYALLNVVIVACAVFICTIGGVFGRVTSILVVALLIYMYLLSLITFGFMISVFFQKAQMASTAGMLFNLFLYGLGWVIHHTRMANTLVKRLLMLFSTISFSLSMIDLISMLPDNGVTLFSLFDFSEHEIGLHLIFLTMDTFLYFGLAWYLDQVVQPDWGSTKHWTFIFPYIWERLQGFVAVLRPASTTEETEPLRKRATGADDLENGEDFNEGCNEWVEAVPQEVRQQGLAVRVRNLVKRFPAKDGMKTVVNKLNLDMYSGEIFGLLGHNGAGKTTTISMLTGMLQIDEGDASIHGYSIRQNGEFARKLISVCPQQNFFFEDLTCLEHLIFFASLRGIDVSEGLEQAGSSAYFYDLVVQKRFLVQQRERIVEGLAKLDGVINATQRSGIIEMERHFARFGLSLFTDPNVEYVHCGGRTVVSARTWAGVLALVEKVGLSDKMFHLPRMLSGGMKRRLWLAIALVGDPKVVFLDEPTSGVDPLGRQELWRLIEDEKIAGRCIVVTTHHMEEADILADRKAIMTAGQLRCVGSSLFLKSRFGIGYYLEVEIQGKVLPTYPIGELAAHLLEFIRRFIPNAQRHVNDAKGSAAAMAAAKRNLLLFSLPLTSVDHFPAFFSALEEARETLYIVEYGVSLSTLEEVFFKLGDEEVNEDETVSVGGAVTGSNTTSTNHTALAHIVTQQRGSLLAKDSATQPSGSFHSRHLSTPRNAQAFSNLGNTDPVASPSFGGIRQGVRGDLVSQRFQKPAAVSTWKFLRAVTTLRFLQIIHNKRAFCVDVILPVIMLIVSLFFRDGGPGGLNFLVPKKDVFINMQDYSGFNTTIPYTIDSRLAGSALHAAYGILGGLPDNIKDLLQLVDVDADANLGAGNAFYLTGELDVKDEEDDDEKELRALAKLPKNARIADTVPMASALRDSPVSGRALRNYLFVKRDKSVSRRQKRYSAGISFEPRSSKTRFKSGEPFWSDGYRLQVRVFYDAGLPHSLPRFLSLLTSAAAKAHFDPMSSAAKKDVSTQPVHIETTSSPLFLDIPPFVTPMTYGMYIMLSLGLSALPSRFGIQIMFDKAGGTKHAMIVMGLPFSLYWLGSFLMNYLAMLFGNFIVCGFIAYFIPLFWSSAIIPVLVCAVFYSASVLLWAYFLSQLFYNLKAYAMTLQLTGMFFALCPAYLVSIFSDASQSGAGWVYSMFVTHLLCSFLLPPYNPIGVLIGYAVIASECARAGVQPTVADYFSLNRLPVWSVIASFTQAVVLFGATVWIDRRHYHMKSPPTGARQTLDVYYQRREMKRQEWLARCGGNQLMIPASLQNHKDEDVKREEFECTKIRRVLTGQLRKYKQTRSAAEKKELSRTLEAAALEDPSFPDELPLILIDNLHYLFLPSTAFQPPHVAVRGFSLSVYRGEIFGLLGPNGAGKTTSINLLTCNYLITAPTQGAAYLGGHDVSRHPASAFSHLGLCPQFDALWADITVRDNLKIFARIKNVPENEIDHVIDAYIEDLELEAHQNKRISECSGGNKRRASVAVAFMGDPDVVLMDEPSSGIDPVGRRRLAELIHRNSQDRCVLITTHSMEEAEALCSRIGIIVNGELNCLNTSLAIRNQYGSGIRLEVIFDDSNPAYTGFDPTGTTLNPWQMFLKEHVSEDVVEIHRVANRVTYDVPLRSSSLGQLFGIMEKNKAQYAVKEYAFSQPTLEQVFITFAKRQKSAQESVQEIFKD